MPYLPTAAHFLANRSLHFLQDHFPQYRSLGLPCVVNATAIGHCVGMMLDQRVGYVAPRYRYSSSPRGVLW